MSGGESKMKSFSLGGETVPDVSWKTNIPAVNIDLFGQGDQAYNEESVSDDDNDYVYKGLRMNSWIGFKQRWINFMKNLVKKCICL